MKTYTVAKLCKPRKRVKLFVGMGLVVGVVPVVVLLIMAARSSGSLNRRDTSELVDVGQWMRGPQPSPLRVFGARAVHFLNRLQRRAMHSANPINAGQTH